MPYDKASVEATDRVLAEMEDRISKGISLVPPVEKPSLLSRIGKGLGRSVEEGLSFTGRNLLEGAQDIGSNFGDFGLGAIGKTALGAAKVIGAIPGGIGITAASALPDVAEEVTGTRGASIDVPMSPMPGLVPFRPVNVSAETLKEIGGGALGAALPVLPGASVLSRLRGAGAVTETAGPLSDLVTAERFTKDVFGRSAGEALRDGLIEKVGAGFKLTPEGMKSASRAATPSVKALPEYKPEPTRVVEAPPPPEKGSSRLRERLRQEQADITGEYAPEGPQARIQMEPAMRDLETGQPVIGPRERPPTEPVPPTEVIGERPPGIRDRVRDFKTGPSTKERVEGYGEDPRPPRQQDLPPPENPRAASLASEPPEIQAAAPPKMRAEATKGDPLPDPDGALTMEEPSVRERVRQNFQGLKAWAAVNSMTEIARGDKPFELLVELTKRTRRTANTHADTWISQRNAIRQALGSDEAFSAALKARDEGLPSTAPPEVSAMIDELYNGIATELGIPPGHPLFKEGYVRRLRQDRAIRETRLVEVEPYTTEDISRIVPGKISAGYLKERKLDTPGDPESYTMDSVGRYIRSAARSAALGTEFKPGYLEEIRPLLEQLSDRPDVIKKTVTDYVNWFIGAPGSRSSAAASEWANRFRSYQFIRTIGGNALSPLWNLTQQSLTAAETTPGSFMKAWNDLPRWLKKDPELVGLLDRAGLAHELEAAGTISEVGGVPEELMGKFDKALATTAKTIGYPFRGTEKWNRVHSFLAGYYDGVKLGLPEEQAIAKGKAVMDKTQFVGGEADIAPRWRSAEGAVVGQYKQFTTKYAEYVYNNFHDMIREGASLEERGEAAKKFAKFWAAQTALGGTTAYQLVPVLGDWLEENVPKLPLNAQRGLGGMLGISLAEQVGLGVLPIEGARSFWYNLPGPTANQAIDTFNLALHFSGAKEMPPDDVAKTITRALPAGSQLNRFRRAVQAWQTGGTTRASQTGLEAIGWDAPSGRILNETKVNPITEAIGFRSEAREQESDIRQKQAEDNKIESEARMRASELFQTGKSKEAQQVLKDAEERIGRKIRLSLGTLRGAQERLRTSPLERLRQQKAKRGVVVPQIEED